MPVGIILILILMGCSILSALFALIHPVNQIGPILLTGGWALIMDWIVIAALGIMFYGIIKRFIWARKVTIGWHAVSMCLLLINLIAFIKNNTMYKKYYDQILTPQMASLMNASMIKISLIVALIFGWIIGIIVIVYLIKKKDFFSE